MSQLSRGGVTLFYDEAGTGDPPIVLVHGGMVNRTNFAPQLQHFSGRHRTVRAHRCLPYRERRLPWTAPT